MRRCEFIARHYHAEQFRKDGVTPYITHPERVASRLLHPVLQDVAWLHDVIEDCGVTATELLQLGVDIAVVETVCHLTQKKGVETYRAYVRRIASSGSWAIAVKLADLADNIEDSAGLPKGERTGLVQRWQASQRTLLAVGADLEGLLCLSARE